jgi:rhodanese-related sulfurtransferase
VAQELEAQGFKDVHALHGGFEAWVHAGQPVEATAGQHATP